MSTYLRSVNEILLSLKSNTIILFITRFLITVPQPVMEQSTTILFHRSVFPSRTYCEYALESLSYTRDLYIFLSLATVNLALSIRTWTKNNSLSDWQIVVFLTCFCMFALHLSLSAKGLGRLFYRQMCLTDQ